MKESRRWVCGTEIEGKGKKYGWKEDGMQSRVSKHGNRSYRTAEQKIVVNHAAQRGAAHLFCGNGRNW